MGESTHHKNLRSEVGGSDGDAAEEAGVWESAVVSCQRGGYTTIPVSGHDSEYPQQV